MQEPSTGATGFPPEYKGDQRQLWIQLTDLPLKEAYAKVKAFDYPWLNLWRLFWGPDGKEDCASHFPEPDERTLVLGVVIFLHALCFLACLGATRLLNVSWQNSWITTGCFFLVAWYVVLHLWWGQPWREAREQNLDCYHRILEETDEERGQRLEGVLAQKTLKLKSFFHQELLYGRIPERGSLIDLQRTIESSCSSSAPPSEATKKRLDELNKRIDDAKRETLKEIEELNGTVRRLRILAERWHDASEASRNALNTGLNDGVNLVLESIKDRNLVNEMLLAKGYQILADAVLAADESSSTDAPSTPEPDHQATA